MPFVKLATAWPSWMLPIFSIVQLLSHVCTSHSTDLGLIFGVMTGGVLLFVFLVVILPICIVTGACYYSKKKRPHPRLFQTRVTTLPSTRETSAVTVDQEAPLAASFDQIHNGDQPSSKDAPPSYADALTLPQPRPPPVL